MELKFDLSSRNYIVTLHDCQAESVSLAENKLTFDFQKNGLSDIFIDKGFQNLKASFILSDHFLDESFIPAVRQSNRNKLFRQSIF